jgi:hypothetical protein
MALTALAVRIAPEESDYLDRLALQHEGILSKQGVVRLLLQYAERIGWDPLDRGITLGKPSLLQAAEPEGGEGFTSTSKSLSSSKSSKNKSICAIPTNLEPHTELIQEFWRVKKGSKGEVAWKLLMGELEKIRTKYGSTVVAEQLQLAINGKWQGVQLKNYEQFLPKGTTAAQAELKHPAYKVFTAERGFDDGPTTNPVLEDLF